MNHSTDGEQGSAQRALDGTGGSAGKVGRTPTRCGVTGGASAVSRRAVWPVMASLAFWRGCTRCGGQVGDTGCAAGAVARAGAGLVWWSSGLVVAGAGAISGGGSLEVGGRAGRVLPLGGGSLL